MYTTLLYVQNTTKLEYVDGFEGIGHGMFELALVCQ